MTCSTLYISYLFEFPKNEFCAAVSPYIPQGHEGQMSDYPSHCGRGGSRHWVQKSTVRDSASLIQPYSQQLRSKQWNWPWNSALGNLPPTPRKTQCNLEWGIRFLLPLIKIMRWSSEGSVTFSPNNSMQSEPLWMSYEVGLQNKKQSWITVRGAWRTASPFLSLIMCPHW